jgi:hypothetical protein
MKNFFKSWFIGVLVSYLTILLIGGTIDIYEALFGGSQTTDSWLVYYLSNPIYILMCLLLGFFIGEGIRFGLRKK